MDLLGWGRLNAFTGEILWYTLDFFPLSRQPQCGICRDEGRLIQCLVEAAPQHPLQPPHCSRIVRHLLRESLVDEGRQPQIFRWELPQPEAEPDELDELAHTGTAWAGYPSDWAAASDELMDALLEVMS